MGGLAAVVVAHDSADALPACLAALAAEGVPALVVDRASALSWATTTAARPPTVEGPL